MTHDPIIRGVYSPSLRQVGCVIIQAAMGGDSRASHAFDSRDWFVSPADDMVMVSAPLSHWRRVAEMPRDQRPAPQERAA